MTKAIEDELNLPRLEDALKAVREANGEIEETTHPEVEKMADALAGTSLTAIAAAQDPSGVAQHIREADDLFEMAVKAHKDLMDLGFNIESKHAGANAFTPAMKALELATKLSQSKTARRMEEIRLVMEGDKHRRDMNNGVEEGEILDSKGPSILANRNDLMDRIRRGDI